MTNSRRFQRCRSLRVHKSPSLLDSVSGGIYDPLEEVDLTGRPARAGTRAKGLIPDTEKTQQNSAWNKGNWSRRATSLRVQKVAHDEATVTGEGVHSLGPGDGQLLIGEVNRKADSKVKKCKKQVNRTLRQGWETFISNIYSLTLSRPTGTPSADSSQSVGAR